MKLYIHVYRSFHEVETHFVTVSLVTSESFIDCFFYITTELSHITVQG